MPGQGARMKPGNLVRVTRAMIGVPAGSLGLLIEKARSAATFDEAKDMEIEVWTVKFFCRDHTRRLLGRDLEIVSC